MFVTPSWIRNGFVSAVCLVLTLAANVNTSYAATGKILVKGDGTAIYDIYVAGGKGHVVHEITGKARDIFPGTYDLKIGEASRQVTVVAGRTTEL